MSSTNHLHGWISYKSTLDGLTPNNYVAYFIDYLNYFVNELTPQRL